MDIIDGYITVCAISALILLWNIGPNWDFTVGKKKKDNKIPKPNKPGRNF